MDHLYHVRPQSTALVAGVVVFVARTADEAVRAVRFTLRTRRSDDLDGSGLLAEVLCPESAPGEFKFRAVMPQQPGWVYLTADFLDAREWVLGSLTTAVPVVFFAW